jgi:hypothetical protein
MQYATSFLSFTAYPGAYGATPLETRVNVTDPERVAEIAINSTLSGLDLMVLEIRGRGPRLFNLSPSGTFKTTS